MSPCTKNLFNDYVFFRTFVSNIVRVIVSTKKVLNVSIFLSIYILVRNCTSFYSKKIIYCIFPHNHQHFSYFHFVARCCCCRRCCCRPFRDFDHGTFPFQLLLSHSHRSAKKPPRKRRERLIAIANVLHHRVSRSAMHRCFVVGCLFSFILKFSCLLQHVAIPYSQTFCVRLIFLFCSLFL